MTPIRKTWWASLALSLPFSVLAVGCGEETPPAVEPVPAPASAPAPADTKAVPSVTPSPTPAVEPKAEAPKTDAAPKGEPTIEAPKIEPPKTETPKADTPAPKADASKLSADEIAAIKKLPAEDATIALAQLTCPVSGEHLGAMDAPIKVTAAGKTFFICCKGCNDEVKTHPAEVVAKLNTK